MIHRETNPCMRRAGCGVCGTWETHERGLGAVRGSRLSTPLSLRATAPLPYWQKKLIGNARACLLSNRRLRRPQTVATSEEKSRKGPRRGEISPSINIKGPTPATPSSAPQANRIRALAPSSALLPSPNGAHPHGGVRFGSSSPTLYCFGGATTSDPARIGHVDPRISGESSTTFFLL